MKQLSYMLLLLLVSLCAVSCSDDDEKEVLSQVTVAITSDKAVSDFTTFTVKVTDKKSGAVYAGKADASGTALFQLPLGAYDVEASDTIQGVNTLYGQALNQTVAEAEARIEVKVADVLASLDQTFVLDQLYFNGDAEGWDRDYYESYLTIRNVSSQPLFADGLSIAICGDYNSVETNDEMSVYLNDNIVISQLYTIPQVDGKHVVVAPGESLVLAHEARNHKADGGFGTVDLSGADFEFYVQYISNGEDYTMTTDNPDVPNMIVDLSASQAFNWGYDGATPILLVRLDDAQKAALLGNLQNMTMPMSWGRIKLDYGVLPASAVIDGVETGDVDAFVRKVVPSTIDRSQILIESNYGFAGQFLQRKTKTNADGITVAVDTNNSADDFEVIAHGQKSYPKQ